MLIGNGEGNVAVATEEVVKSSTAAVYSSTRRVSGDFRNRVPLIYPEKP